MIVEALSYLHSNFRLHRDVKPENILFPTEERSVVKLADFDMCCICPEGEDFIVGSSIVGTPGYLAPEVLGLKRYSRQSDMFALGALMYFCATGEAPKDTTSEREVSTWCAMTELQLVNGRSDCMGKSPEFGQALGSLLKADPASRPDHIEKFMDCEWLQGSVGGLKKKKNSQKKTSLKKTTSDETTIQRLLTIQVDLESRQCPSAASAA